MGTKLHSGWTITGTTTTAFISSTTMIAIQANSVATFGTQTQSLGNLFNGNEASLRLDYNWNTNNRFYIQYNYDRNTDSFGPCNAACTRGFSNPFRALLPQGSRS